MSYYMMDYSMTDPGTPGHQFAPYPSWGMNPAAAGPRRVGVGADSRTADNTSDAYKQTSWGVVAAASAGGIALGVLLGYLAAKRKSMRPNRSRRGRRRYTANVRWSRKYKNQLPDSHFAYVAPGGHKVRTKRGTFTIPKTSRKLPYINLQGNIDKSHLRNAIARVGQKKTQIPAAEKKRIQRRLQHLYAQRFGYARAPEKLAA